MQAKLIDGKEVAAELKKAVAAQVDELKADYGITPGLATVLVGDDPASATYVRMKHKACAAVGIRSMPHRITTETTQLELEQLIDQLNADPAVHGILVQLPLPDHMSQQAIIDRIAINKDVDGFHPLNIGRLAMRGVTPDFIPCTPYGVLYLLKLYGVVLEGIDAVVVGRSTIVGLPMFFLLQKENATVTLCHKQTADLAAHLQKADLVVVGAGVPGLITGAMLKPGAVVIDVGTNRVPAPERKSGHKLVGDVEFESASKVASLITPVPGGVGPMTIAMLMQNTATAAARSVGETTL